MFGYASYRSSILLTASLFTGIIVPINGSYLTQAICGHFRIMNSRVSIEKRLLTNQLDWETRNKLKMVLNVREYASNFLGLPKNKSYTMISDINGKYPGWNVYCAPKFSVEPKKWCFPIAGCVVYRGYFSRQKAVEFAEKMEEKGFDVFIGPFSAYSTLGWYDDPLLSSHLLLDSIQLAGLIIHELAHQEVYASGDSRFNEGFAVSVERAGVLQWLKSVGRDDLIIQALEKWKEEDLRIGQILNTRSQLNDIYLNYTESKVLSQKKDSLLRCLEIYLTTAADTGKNLPKTDGEDFELNNAYFAPINAYYSLVPVFNKILDSCDGSFQLFFERIEKLKKLPYEERQQTIDSCNKMSNQQKSHF
jgi:predicted aminopeptidase